MFDMINQSSVPKRSSLTYKKLMALATVGSVLTVPVATQAAEVDVEVSYQNTPESLPMKEMMAVQVQSEEVSTEEVVELNIFEEATIADNSTEVVELEEKTQEKPVTEDVVSVKETIDNKQQVSNQPVEEKVTLTGTEIVKDVVEEVVIPVEENTGVDVENVAVKPPISNTETANATVEVKFENTIKQDTQFGEVIKNPTVSNITLTPNRDEKEAHIVKMHTDFAISDNLAVSTDVNAYKAFKDFPRYNNALTTVKIGLSSEEKTNKLVYGALQFPEKAVKVIFARGSLDSNVTDSDLEWVEYESYFMIQNQEKIYAKYYYYEEDKEGNKVMKESQPSELKVTNVLRTTATASGNFASGGVQREHIFTGTFLLTSEVDKATVTVELKSADNKNEYTLYKEEVTKEKYKGAPTVQGYYGLDRERYWGGNVELYSLIEEIGNKIDGKHTLVFKVTDEYGNETSREYEYVFDGKSAEFENTVQKVTDTSFTFQPKFKGEEGTFRYRVAETNEKLEPLTFKTLEGVDAISLEKTARYLHVAGYDNAGNLTYEVIDLETVK